MGAPHVSFAMWVCWNKETLTPSQGCLSWSFHRCVRNPRVSSRDACGSPVDVEGFHGASGSIVERLWKHLDSPPHRSFGGPEHVGSGH